nr:precorrin-6A/cobalt-precorrin-6A reductase [Ruminococcus sp. HUN007]
MLGNGYTAVVDATHPYAENITANIREAVTRSGYSEKRYIRVKREPEKRDEAAVYLENAGQAADYLKKY